jgi:uncharacterized membrane protein
MEIRQMKINWKRVLIAAIWGEILLIAIYIPAKQYAGSAFGIIAGLEMLGSMFLCAFWATRNVESRFVLHGLLVGIFANVLFYTLFFSFRSIVWTDEPSGTIAMHIFDATLKILGAAIGGYFGGRLREKSLA